MHFEDMAKACGSSSPELPRETAWGEGIFDVCGAGRTTGRLVAGPYLTRRGLRLNDVCRTR